MEHAFEQLDPRQAWQPADLSQWDLRRVGHLYRRAAFGFPAAEASEPSWVSLRERVKLGAEGCLEELLGKPGDTASPTRVDQLLDQLGERIASGDFSPGNLNKLQGWWLYRMLYSPRPLIERATLMWHNHFATSIEKVNRLPLMLKQNQLIRRHALGSFPELLTAMGRDPAMIIWLDSDKNVKGSPNENYAREVMELFSLGVGNYSEHDIREAARALTGFTLQDDAFLFQPTLHDDGSKTIFGQTGNFNGDDVARLVLEQPAAATYIAGKLFREFVADRLPPAELLEPLAAQLRATNYDIRQALSTIFRSQVFYSPAAYRARIKSPVEYVVGLLRAFNTRVQWEYLASAMDGLGQRLFQPPNVKGWDGGTSWINSATIIARHNLAWDIVQGGHYNTANAAALLAVDQEGKSPGDRAALAIELFLQNDIAPPVRNRLMELADAKGGQAKPIEEIVHLILTLPEYQLA